MPSSIHIYPLQYTYRKKKVIETRCVCLCANHRLYRVPRTRCSHRKVVAEKKKLNKLVFITQAVRPATTMAAVLYNRFTYTHTHTHIYIITNRQISTFIIILYSVFINAFIIHNIMHERYFWYSLYSVYNFIYAQFNSMHIMHIHENSNYIRSLIYIYIKKKNDIYVLAHSTYISVCDCPARWYYLFFTYTYLLLPFIQVGDFREENQIMRILTNLWIMEFPVTCMK